MPHASRITRHPRLALLLLALCAALAAATGLGTGLAQTPPAATAVATPGTTAPTGVVREVLSRGEPSSAPGYALELVRYTIPADSLLPPHIHPGMQTVQVVSGTLHYTVVDGEVPVYRAADPETLVLVTPADGEVAFGPGDAFSEPEGVVHFGRNAGPEPVVILVASLFEADEPSAILIDLGTPVASPAP